MRGGLTIRLVSHPAVSFPVARSTAFRAWLALRSARTVYHTPRRRGAAVDALRVHTSRYRFSEPAPLSGSRIRRSSRSVGRPKSRRV